MSTTTKVRWHNEGDAGFKARFEDAFVEWFQQNNTFDVEVGSGHEWVKTSITFDDACVLYVFCCIELHLVFTIQQWSPWDN